jgi:hypothetical protein
MAKRVTPKPEGAVADAAVPTTGEIAGDEKGLLPEASSSLPPVSPAPSDPPLDGATQNEPAATDLTPPDPLVDGVARNEVAADAENPSTATAPEEPASGAGGPSVDDDRRTLEEAIASITGAETEILPVSADLSFIPSGMVVRVTGPKKGRRRINRVFNSVPVEISLDELSPHERMALTMDKALKVEIVPAS